jgi:hypothetical protein
MLAPLTQVFLFSLILLTNCDSAADEDDAYDLSFLTKGAAIGDS